MVTFPPRKGHSTPNNIKKNNMMMMMKGEVYSTIDRSKIIIAIKVNNKMEQNVRINLA